SRHALQQDKEVRLQARRARSTGEDGAPDRKSPEKFSAISEVLLVPVGDVERALVDYLAAVLPGELGSTCKVASQPVDLSGAYHAIRSQYNSTQILGKLLDLRARPTPRLSASATSISSYPSSPSSSAKPSSVAARR